MFVTKVVAAKLNRHQQINIFNKSILILEPWSKATLVLVIQVIVQMKMNVFWEHTTVIPKPIVPIPMVVGNVTVSILSSEMELFVKFQSRGQNTSVARKKNRTENISYF